MEDLLIQISKDAANAKFNDLSQSATEAYGSVLYNVNDIYITINIYYLLKYCT